MSKVKQGFNPDYYDELVAGRKNTAYARIIVSETKQQKPENNIATVDVEHQTISNPIHLRIECHKVDQSKFGFKLFEKMFDQKPYFRFESSGSTDRNNFDDIPLAEQSVTTPHFHKFDERGRFVVFKTDAIRDLLPTDTVADHCFVEFCNETNMRYNDSSYPTIETTPSDELKLGISEIDPLKNITFVHNGSGV